MLRQMYVIQCDGCKCLADVQPVVMFRDGGAFVPSWWFKSKGWREKQKNYVKTQLCPDCIKKENGDAS